MLKQCLIFFSLAGGHLSAETVGVVKEPIKIITLSPRQKVVLYSTIIASNCVMGTIFGRTVLQSKNINVATKAASFIVFLAVSATFSLVLDTFFKCHYLKKFCENNAIKQENV